MASFAVLQSVPIASVDALVSTLDDYASRFGDAVPGASVQRSLLERTLGFVRAYEPEQDRVSREPPEEPLVVVSSLDGAHDAVEATGAAAKKRGRGDVSATPDASLGGLSPGTGVASNKAKKSKRRDELAEAAAASTPVNVERSGKRTRKHARHDDEEIVAEKRQERDEPSPSPLAGAEAKKKQHKKAHKKEHKKAHKKAHKKEHKKAHKEHKKEHKKD